MVICRCKVMIVECSKPALFWVRVGAASGASMGLNLIEELRQLVGLLAERGIEYAICGGVAVNIHGHVRTTRDIDLLIQQADLGRMLDAARELGFDIPAGPIPFQRGTDRERILYRASKVEEGAILTIDLVLVTPVFEDVWETRQRFRWLEREVAVVSLEGLAKMKLMAGRHQDLADLENLGIEPEDEDR